MQEQPVDGIYFGVPDPVYRAWDAVSQSKLKAVMACPIRARYYWDHPDPPTESMEFGRLVHLAVYEPEKIKSSYVVADKPSQRSNAGKAEWARILEEASANKQDVCSTQDYDEAMLIGESVRSHPQVKPLFESTYAAELSGLWTDPDSGMRCKFRLDGWHQGQHVTDLKSTKSAEPRSFFHSVRKYGYDIQEAFYRAGLVKLGLDVNDYLIIAVEKSPPYVVQPYRLSASLVEQAWESWKKGMNFYQKCLANNYWPGYSDEVIELGDSA